MKDETKDRVTRLARYKTLCWCVGIAALVVYLLTLNRWISLQGLGAVARTSGWLWQPELQQPLAWLVLAPFGWLPERWIPLALNIFSAICASGVLVLLARSVDLLPHDVALQSPLKKAPAYSLLSTPNAWLPPVLAAVLCGLQLSFWEHATSASVEMLNLLVFACALWCLLEFRVSENERWLYWAALVYGAGMSNDWVMVAYFPVFVFAIWRLKGFALVYDRRLLVRISFCGTVGLGFYLLLPAVQSLAAHSQAEFLTALKAHLKGQAMALGRFRLPGAQILALTSLVPVLLLSFPWNSHTAQESDDSRLGVFLLKAIGHLVHVLCFLGVVWVSLDPPFSPRHLEWGRGLLPFYYLSAMVAGYCAGYFFLFGKGGPHRVSRRWPGLAVYGLFAALPVALVSKNLPQIRLTNGPNMRQFATHLAEDLPRGKSIVLSEDAAQLLLVRAQIGFRHPEKDPLLLDIGSLGSPQYQAAMARQFGARWPVPAPTNTAAVIGPLKMLNLVSKFATREQVVYLHPSSGLFFEEFISRPNGFVQVLSPRAVTNRRATPLEKDFLAANEELWQERWRSNLQNLAQRTAEIASRRKPRGVGWFASRTGLSEPNATGLLLCGAYSKALNHWGVQEQRAGDWTNASVWFQRAIELNSANLSAQINLTYNQARTRGDARPLGESPAGDQFRDRIAKFRSWGEFLTQYGPLDEPTFLFAVAHAYREGNNYSQAAQAFARCVELVPDWPEPRLWLALDLLDMRDFGGALEVTDQLGGQNAPKDGSGLSRLLLCRTSALQGLGRTNEAIAWVESFANEHRDHDAVLSEASRLFEANGQFRKQLVVLEPLLAHDPGNAELLTKKGFAQFRLGLYTNAIATLTKGLELAPNSQDARRFRASALMGDGQLDPAAADYKQLLSSAAEKQHGLFGLATIAWRRHETNTAMQLYQQYLSNSPPATPQYIVATERLKALANR